MTKRNSTDTSVSKQVKPRSTKRLNTAEFIRRSKDAHGNRFSYERTTYKNHRTKVTVTCSKHGDVLISVQTHLNSDGCPDCVFENNPKRWDTKKFIAKAVERFGNLYDYSLVDYQNKNTMIKVICPTHGVTNQRAYVHLKSLVGCPHCNGNGRLDNARFISLANKVHDYEYDYSLVEYSKSTSLVSIKCKEHGLFQSVASHHLDGQKCPECSKENLAIYREAERKKSANNFIIKAREAHRGFYNYDFVEYENSVAKVIIVCPVHGKFEQSPSSHINHGCNDCAIKYKIEARRRKEASAFVGKAVARHGLKYNYDLVNYVSSKGRVKIRCPHHDIFLQTVADHLAGCGCPDCGRETGSGWSRGDFLEYAKGKSNGQAKLYVIKCFDGLEVFYKIGITARSVAERFKDVQAMPYDYSIVNVISERADYIYDIETQLHRLLKNNKHEPTRFFRGSMTECFTTIKPVEKLLKELSNTDQLQLIA